MVVMAPVVVAMAAVDNVMVCFFLECRWLLHAGGTKNGINPLRTIYVKVCETKN